MGAAHLARQEIQDTFLSVDAPCRDGGRPSWPTPTNASAASVEGAYVAAGGDDDVAAGEHPASRRVAPAHVPCGRVEDTQALLTGYGETAGDRCGGEELAVGLQAISLWSGGNDWLGISNPGVVAIAAWQQELWWPTIDPEWVNDNAEILDLLSGQARAYMLIEVLVHELGHHHDRMTTRGSDAPRGEPYATAYAREARAKIWSDYVRRFRP
jgi:hypothetical protein